MASFKGTNKGETLRGSALADKIQALGGDDIIYGLAGNDTIDAGAGNDLIQGGAGSDTIDGGLGTDTLDFSDVVGSVRIRATDYATSTTGKGTAEAYDAWGGLVATDTFSGIENIIGSAGNDYVSLSGANSSIWGGGGDDWLSGGGGNDNLYGGSGDDLLYVAGGTDLLDGGDGIDTVVFGGGPSGLVVDLQAGTISYTGYPGADSLVGIENVRGGDGNKQIFGDDASNIVQGSTGSDLIDGRGGDDVLVGDYGRNVGGVNTSPSGFNDTIRGGAGNDLISGDEGTDVLTGGGGADTFVVDTYYGTDRITDFEDGVDKLSLYGGLTITGWEARDTNGDGVADAQAALLSNGQALIFDGYTAAPSSLAGGAGLELHSEQFAIPELTDWSATSGWGGMGL